MPMESVESEEDLGVEGIDANSTRKRRRCDTIERRLERLRLDQVYQDGSYYAPSTSLQPMSGFPHAPGMVHSDSTASTNSVDSVASYSTVSSAHTYIPTLNDIPLRNAYAVEEPPSPEFREPSLGTWQSRGGASAGYDPGSGGDYGFGYTAEPEQSVPEVTMRGTLPAWYEREKDRIVITDLEEVIAEEERAEEEAIAAERARIEREKEEEYASSAEPHPDSAEYAETNADLSVSEVLLNHIRKRANFPYRAPPVLPPSEEERIRGALVLFRPLPLPEGELNSANPDWKHKIAEQGDVQVEEIDVDEAQSLSPQNTFVTGTPVYDDDDAMDVEF